MKATTRHILPDVFGWIGALGARRAARASLDEHEQHYRELINGLPQLLWTSGPDGAIDFLNQWWNQYTGIGVAEQLGRGWLEQVHPDDRSQVEEVWRAALASGEAMAVEARIRRHDGVYRWFDLRATPLRDAVGQIVRWFGSNLDIEDRRTAEQRFRRLYESNLIGIAFYEAGQRLSDPNEALLEMLGCRPEEYAASGLNWRDLVAEEELGAEAQQAAILRKLGRCGPYETELLGKDGRRIPVLISRAHLAAGDYDQGVTFVVDLRRIKRAEEALRRTEAALRTANDLLEQRVRDRTAELEAQSARLRAMALDLTETESRERKRLAQVLHDHFQQLLSAAKMKIGIIRRRADDRSEIESLKQTENLLEEAIAASRSLATELSPPVLHDAGLATSFEWLARRMEKQHNLLVRLDLAGWQEPDNEQVRTILFECVRELLFNVAKHSGAGSAQVTAAALSEGLLQVRVIDHGKGFDVCRAETKPQLDTSFGLFSIRERLGLIGGLLKVVSAPGHGTTVELTVPATVHPRAAPADRAGPIEAAAPDLTGSGRVFGVLVADDHKLFREGLIALLNQESYLRIVGEAGDGQEAVDLARQLHPDIMIVDVTMPKLNGVQVTATISKELPDVKIIGLSMHERDDMAEAMRNAGAVAYCAKSAPIESLVSILRNTAANDVQAPGTQ